VDLKGVFEIPWGKCTHKRALTKRAREKKRKKKKEGKVFRYGGKFLPPNGEGVKRAAEALLAREGEISKSGRNTRPN